MNLHAGRVDEQAVGGAIAARQRAEYPFPDAAFRPTDKAVIERLLRTVDFARTVGPAPAIPQSMNDPAQYPTIVDTRHAARIGR